MQREAWNCVLLEGLHKLAPTTHVLSLALFIVVRRGLSVLGYRPLERVVVEPEVRQQGCVSHEEKRRMRGRGSSVQLLDEIDVGEQHTAAAVPSEAQSVQGITGNCKGRC